MKRRPSDLVYTIYCCPDCKHNHPMFMRRDRAELYQDQHGPAVFKISEPDELLKAECNYIFGE